MSRAAIEQLLYLTDNAFETVGTPADEAHSLLSNLRAINDDDWLWKPPGGERTIAAIVGHIGACKYMYDDKAFGNGAMGWNDPVEGFGRSIDEMQSGPLGADGQLVVADVIAWLREGHRRWRDNVAQLNDHELAGSRSAPWDEMKETRWLIVVMIEHDLYHAGEINHIRALRQGTDRWAWEMEAASQAARPEVLEG